MVVRGDKPVIAPEDEAYMNNVVHVVDRHGQQLNVGEPAGRGEVGFERGPWMERRNYRDSAYAVMAAMYHLLRPDVHHQVKTSEVEAAMRGFTDHDVRFDYRNRKVGAFKAMDQLVELNLVYKTRGVGESDTCTVPLYYSIVDALLMHRAIAHSVLFNSASRTPSRRAQFNTSFLVSLLA